MVDTVNHNVRTSVIDFTTARSTFVGNNATSAPPKLLKKNSEVEGGRKPINVTAFEHWEKGQQLWHSKWPGWQGFFQSRYSGWPIALIFAPWMGANAHKTRLNDCSQLLGTSCLLYNLFWFLIPFQIFFLKKTRCPDVIFLLLLGKLNLKIQELRFQN